jgi:hypothetical protein
MGDRRGAYRVLVGIPRTRDTLKDLGIDGRFNSPFFLIIFLHTSDTRIR